MSLLNASRATVQSNRAALQDMIASSIQPSSPELLAHLRTRSCIYMKDIARCFRDAEETVPECQDLPLNVAFTVMFTLCAQYTF